MLSKLILFQNSSIYFQDDIERFKLKEERNKFKKAVPPSKKRKYDEDSDESESDITGSSDGEDDDHEPEVKQRKIAAPKQQLAELSDDDDVQVIIQPSNQIENIYISS